MIVTFIVEGAEENLAMLNTHSVPRTGDELEFTDFEKGITVRHTVKRVSWRLTKYPTMDKLGVFVILQEKYCQDEDQAGGRPGGGR